MYVGHMVEWGESDSVTQTPRHPYTQLLISAVPEAGVRKAREKAAKKAEIPTFTPDSRGCPFAGRCLKAMDQCRTDMPGVTQVEEDHYVRCHLY
jgi:peptide/nickel transport system ATP-binding protein